MRFGCVVIATNTSDLTIKAGLDSCVVQLCIRMNICFESLRLFKIIICEQLTLNRTQKLSANRGLQLVVGLQAPGLVLSYYELVNTHSYVPN